MSTYDTLYRIKKMELQSCQQRKIKLEKAILSLEEKESALDAEMNAQDELIRQHNGFRWTYASFFERYRKRKTHCQEERGLVRKELAQLLRTMHAKFGEMKKMELLQQKQEEKERQQFSKFESQSQDEHTTIRIVREGFGLNS